MLTQLPKRGSASTKFSSGALLVIGGARGLSGAPALAAMAAARAGAGYVIVAVPEEIVPIVASARPELMVADLPSVDGALAPAALDPALAAAERARAVVLGPGLGRSAPTRSLIAALALALDVPLVLDADGMNAFAGRIELLRDRRAATILTPHAGELARLLETDATTVERTRLASTVGAAERTGAIVVLKGDDTLVAAPPGFAGEAAGADRFGIIAISPGGAPALATAGTGDVLAGVTGALLARGSDPITASCAAVLAHLRAGQIAAIPHGPDGVIASDVIAALPQALTS